MNRFLMGKILMLSMWLLLCCSLYVQAEETSYVKIDNEVFYYDENGDGTVSIVCPAGSYPSYFNGEHIPEEINGMPVTTISKDAYHWYTHMGNQNVYKSVVIPEGVTTIESGAFRDLKVDVTLPDSLTIIEDNAFENCVYVDFHISSSHPNFATIDNVLFEKKTKRLICGSAADCNDRYYEIPRGILEISTGAFWNSFMTVAVPDTVEKIDEGAFRHCEGLVVDPENVHYGMNSGKYLVEYDTETLLYYVEDDLETYLPEGIRRIGEYAMCNIEYLRSITLPESVTEIGAHAFEGSSITSITLPDSVTVIEDYAFAEAEELTEVYMSYEVTSIGAYAFYEAKHLNYIWLPDTLTELGEAVFYKCNALESISIPSGIKTIKQKAFWAAGLRDVYFSEGLECIEKSAFTSCHMTNQITFPSTLKRIEDEAFQGNSLGEIVIPDRVEFIGVASFDSRTTLVVSEGSCAEAWIFSESNIEGTEIKYVSDDDWLNAPVEEEESEEEFDSSWAYVETDFYSDDENTYGEYDDSYYAASVIGFFGLSQSEFSAIMGEEPYFSEGADCYMTSLFGLPPSELQVCFDSGILTEIWWTYSFEAEEEEWYVPVHDLLEDISETMELRVFQGEQNKPYESYFWKQDNIIASAFCEYIDGRTEITFQANMQLY